MMRRGSFIGIEWGTQALRALHIDEAGSVLDASRLEVSMQGLNAAGIERTLADVVNQWATDDQTVWLAGMIGSKGGWQFVPQLDCPAGVTELARASAMTMIAGRPCRILPGLKVRSSFGDPDVLRGEEVAACGWLESCPADYYRVLLLVPGMHAKWLTATGNKFVDFSTAMTAELGTLLGRHGIFSTMSSGPIIDGPVFRAAVRAGAQGGGLARLLFSCRSRVLFGETDEAEALSGVWGTLIGNEVADVLRAQPGRHTYAVAGAPDVVELYSQALVELGVEAERLDSSELAARGFAAFRRAISH